MAELLNTLVEYIWIADFIVFCILGALASSQRQFSSSIMTQSTVIIISGIIMQYEKLVFSIVAPATNQDAFGLWLIGFTLLDATLIFVLFRLYGIVKSKTESSMLRSGSLFVCVAFVVTTMFGQYTTLYLGSEGVPYKVWELLAFHLGLCLFYSLAIFAITKSHNLANLRHMLIARTYILAFTVEILIQVTRLYEKFFFETNYLAGLYKWGSASINVGTTAIAIVVTSLATWQHFNKSKRQGLLWTP